LAGLPAQLAASTFNQLGQYASRAYSTVTQNIDACLTLVALIQVSCVLLFTMLHWQRSAWVQ